MSIALQPDAPLWRATELDVVCTRSSAGQTFEAAVPGGAPIASGDGKGTICDASAGVLLQTPIHGGGPRSVVLAVADALERPIGTARVDRYTIGPRARKATLLVGDATGAQLATLEPRDGKGHEAAVTDANGTELGVVRRTGHKRGLRRSTTTYRVELGGAPDETVRALTLAVTLRYHAILTAIANAVAADRD